jgi:hypothetical protein
MGEMPLQCMPVTRMGTIDTHALPSKLCSEIDLTPLQTQTLTDPKPGTGGEQKKCILRLAQS